MVGGLESNLALWIELEGIVRLINPCRFSVPEEFSVDIIFSRYRPEDGYVGKFLDSTSQRISQ